jgi:hypothetical protein
MKIFKPKHPRGEFCSAKCRNRHWLSTHPRMIDDTKKPNPKRKSVDRRCAEYDIRHPHLWNRIQYEFRRNPDLNIACLMYGLRDNGAHFPNEMIAYYRKKLKVIA